MMKSGPYVMFTWDASPACKLAIKEMDILGANVKIVWLDDPQDEGNKFQAELGKITGMSSVLSVCIIGKYSGGYNAGTDIKSPGMVDPEFGGKLKHILEEEGALDSKLI